ncbi:porin [Variovorax sp. GB1P17]|uniref:porin n=1 Tax=Variovorax sp. GB1P17 TaxID=3443740 RepID=UPI003F473531
MRIFAMGLAAAGFAGAACAQSSITLFGVLDAGISGYSNKSADAKSATLANPFYLNKGSRTASQTVLSNSGLASSRLGFRGTEDMGGGLAASFWLEAALTNDSGLDGLQSFARRSTVSLSGGFGEIRLGRDINATFANDFVFDPLGVNGVGINLLYRAGTAMSKLGVPQPAPVPGQAPVSAVLVNAYARSSNMVAYFLPANLGGFYGQVQYAFNEKNHASPGALTPAATDTRSGRFTGGRFGYERGPLNVALAASRNTLASDYLAGSTLRQDTINLGASYDLSAAKLFGEVSRIRNRTIVSGVAAGTSSDLDLTGLMFGVTVPVGPGLIRASYAKVKYDYNRPFSTTPDPKARQLALSYVHNLSKRTALYASVARIDNKNGASLSVGGPSYVSGAFSPKRSTGYDLGLRHAF